MLKSLWVDLRGTLAFVLAFSIGLVGLTVILSVRSSVEDHMAGRAQELSSSDINISARRIFDPNEKSLISKALGSYPHHSVFSLFTMAVHGEQSKLTYLKAVPEDYPFYGELKDQNNKDIRFSNSSEYEIYGDQQLFDQLNVQIGDFVQIGETQFKLVGKVEEDSSQSLRFSALAPKAYILKDHLSATGLIQFGSTISETVYVKAPLLKEQQDLKTHILREIPDSSIRVRTAKESAQGSIRALKYLGDYLGLISLVGFLLSALGAGFIFFGSLNKQLKAYSILQSLGLSRKSSLFYLAIHILILCVLASIFSFLLSIPLLKLTSNTLVHQLSLDISLGFTFETFGMVFLLALFSAFIISLPHFWALLYSPMRILLDENAKRINLNRASSLVFVLSFAFVMFVSFLLAKSFRLAGFFSLGTLTVFFVTGSIGVFLIELMSRARVQSWIKLAFQEMRGKRRTQLILFSVLTLSVLMINTISQIEHSLQKQLEIGKDSEIPDYFLFDIQDEQVEPLKKAVAESGLELLRPSPMVRAKMLSINGQAYEQSVDENRFETREQEEEARFRNRGLNLSYRADLQPGEELTAGEPLSELYKPGTPLELSVEEDYAKRVDISLGDRIEMDIQGMTVEGVVKNLRRVSWTTFLPNFFIVTQPGFLEDAPKTWLAGITGKGEVNSQSLISQFNKDFPNVSFINLDDVISMIKDITGQMAQALFLTALLVLIAGLFILFSVTRYHFFENQKDLNLLRILGADSTFLAKKVLLEQLFLSTVSLFIGLTGSAILSVMILDRIFEARLHWKLSTPLFLITGLILLSAIMTGLVFNWSRKTSPRQFLN